MPSPIGITLTANVGNFTSKMNSAVQSFNQLQYTADNVSRNVKGSMRNAFRGVGLVAGTGLMAGFAAAHVGKGILGLSASMVEEATQFNFQMREMAGITGEDFGSAFIQGMDKKITAAAMESVFSPAEMGSAVTALLTQGIPKSDIEGAFAQVGKMAEASFGKLSIKKAAELAAVGLQKFNVEGKNTEEQFARVADMMTALRTSSTMDWSDISGWMSSMKAAPTLLETTSTAEIFALSGALKSSGSTARSAGQQLNMIARNVIKMTKSMALGDEASKQYKRSLEVLGLTMDDLVHMSGPMEGKTKSIVDILNNLMEGRKSAAERGFKDFEIDIAVTGFAQTKTGLDFVKQMDKMNATLDDGTKVFGKAALEHLTQKIKDSEGITDRLVAQFRASYTGQFKILEGAFKTILKTLGVEIMKSLVPALKMVTSTVKRISEYLDKNPKIVRILTKLVLGLGFGLVLVGIAIGTISAGLLVVTGLVAALPMIGEALAAIFTTTGAIIAASVVGVVFLLGAITTIAAKTGVFTLIASKIKKVFTLISNLSKLSSQGFLSDKAVADMEKSGLLKTFVKLWGIITRLKVAWKGMWKSDILKETFNHFDALISGWGDLFKDGIELMFPKKLQDILLNFADTDPASWEKLGKFIGDMIGMLLIGVRTFLEFMLGAAQFVFFFAKILVYSFVVLFHIIVEFVNWLSTFKDGLLALAIVIGVVVGMFSLLSLVLGLFIGMLMFVSAMIMIIPLAIIGFVLFIWAAGMTFAVAFWTLVAWLTIKITGAIGSFVTALGQLAGNLYDFFMKGEGPKVPDQQPAASPTANDWTGRKGRAHANAGLAYGSGFRAKPEVDMQGPAFSSERGPQSVDVSKDRTVNIQSLVVTAVNPEELASSIKKEVMASFPQEASDDMVSTYSSGGTF